jgi:hypothetical protein
MSRTLDEVYAVIARMPNDAGEKSRLRDIARRYDRACGCGTSGAFLTIAILACAACLMLADPFRWSLIAVGAACIFGAGLLGKAIGIGWAKMRLRLLHRSLIQRIPA